MSMAAPDHRRRELAQIHIAKAQLGMADDAYRAMLWTIGRVRSAADLDYAGRQRVLEHLKKCGFIQKKPPSTASYTNRAWAWVNNAAPDRQPLLRKIAMQLKSAGREKAYADGTAHRMFGVDLVEFCAPDQLRRIVSALEFDRRRHASKGE